MNQPINEQTIAEYYRSQSLPDEVSRSILSQRQLIISSRRWKYTAWLSTAALIAMCCLTFYFANQTRRLKQTVSILRQTPDQQRPFQQVIPVTPATEAPQTLLPQFQIVAFRSHGDGCPHCKKTGEIYVQLKQEFPKSQIKTDIFELNQPDNNSQLEQIAQRNLTNLIANRQETAFFAILSPDGEVIEQFPAQSGLASIQSSIENIIEQ